MNKKQCARAPGWGVRPPDWDYEKNLSSDSEADEETNKVVVNCDSIGSMEEKEFANWVSAKWNLLEFDGTKPVTERKNEWDRFIGQFGRIIAVRRLSSSQKLQALKIQAGAHLNDVIKIQMQRGEVSSEENYEKVLADLGNYFNQACDSMQERSKFREMRMKYEESFVDYELRCEKQIKYCNFSKEHADEELAEALIKRSIPEISKHLRLSAFTLQNDIFAIIRQATHLDHIYREEAELKAQQQDASMKPVMAVQSEQRQRRQSFSNSRQSRFVPYKKNFNAENEKPRNWLTKFHRTGPSMQDACGKCAGVHQRGNCPANGRRCMKCKRFGHYARCCRSEDSSDRKESMDLEVKTVNQVKPEIDKRPKYNTDEE